MVAAKAGVEEVTYPALACPKHTGLRCLMVEGVPMSSTMKAIGNRYVQRKLHGLHGLDGVLVSSDSLMSTKGKPNFTYLIHDLWDYREALTHRLDMLTARSKTMGHWADVCRIVRPVTVATEDELERYLSWCVDRGYPGAMVRNPAGPYKQGRSTVGEGYCLSVEPVFS